MNAKLKLVFDRIAALPEAERAEMVALIESWLDDEALWEKRFRERPEVLDRLIAEAEADIAASLTSPLETPNER